MRDIKIYLLKRYSIFVINRDKIEKIYSKGKNCIIVEKAQKATEGKG